MICGEFNTNLDEIGKQEKKPQLDMTSMRAVITQTGWTDAIPEVLNLQPKPLEIVQTGSQ